MRSINKIPQVLILTAFLLAATSAFQAHADSTNIALHLRSASAIRGPMVVAGVHTNAVSFSCELAVDNQTGGKLNVTGLHSPFDAMRLVVFDASGKKLTSQGHGDAISTIKTQSFTLPEGQTSEKLYFAWLAIPESARSVKIQIEGGLPESSFTGSLTSNVVEVNIRQ